MNKLFCSLMWGLLVLLTQTAWAWPPNSYSVEVVTKTGGRTVRTDTVQASAGKKRVESSPSGGEIQIIRPDKGVTWLLLPNKTYLELPYKKPVGESHDVYDIPAGKAPRTKLGSEKRNGVLCDKYRVKSPEMANAWILWVDRSRHAPVHMEDEKKLMQIEWRNLKLTPPPKSVFEIPAGYSQVK